MSDYNFIDNNFLNNTSIVSSLQSNTLDIPDSVLSEQSIQTEPVKKSSNVGKIILIVILSILIIVSVIFIFIFRNNLITAESNENPSCPQLNCNVNDPNYVADPDCGASAFRFDSSGKKICSSTRYA